jgi:hypothetical protein
MVKGCWQPLLQAMTGFATFSAIYKTCLFSALFWFKKLVKEQHEKRVETAEEKNNLVVTGRRVAGITILLPIRDFAGICLDLKCHDRYHTAQDHTGRGTAVPAKCTMVYLSRVYGGRSVAVIYTIIYNYPDHI